MNRLPFWGLIPFVAALFCGCQAPAPTPLAFSHVRLPGVDQSTAFDALHVAMRERFDLASVDAGAGIIRGVPTESQETNNQGRVGDLVGVSRRVRRVATGQVTADGGVAEVWCKIVVQQHDTQAARLFDNEMRLNDAPTTTAAERDAATTREQNEVWRSTSRDRQGEREILRAVEERAAALGGAQPIPAG